MSTELISISCVGVGEGGATNVGTKQRDVHVQVWGGCRILDS